MSHSLGRLQAIQVTGRRDAGRDKCKEGQAPGHAGAGGQHIPMVAEKMTMPSTFMPSLVPGSDL